MQVAQLRSCYETDCRFFRDDPRPSRIRWFFVPEDTPYLPFGTIFDSNEWLDVPEGDIELGEVPGAVRTWVDGSAPYPVLGLQPCGTADQFASGDALPPSPPVQLNQYGGILCCQIPPDPFLHNACVNCPNGAYSVYWLRSQGANPAGFLAGSDGDFTLSYLGACTWRGPLVALPNWPGGPAQGRWALTQRGTSIAAGMFIESPPSFNEEYTFTGSWDCRSRITVPINAAGIIYGGGPAVFFQPGFPPGPFTPCPAAALSFPAFFDYVVPPLGVGPPRNIDLLWTLIPGTYPLARSGPCTWFESHWPSLSQGFFPFARGTAALQILAGGGLTLTLQCRSGIIVGDPPLLTLVYESPGPWDGISVLALSLSSVSPPGSHTRLPLLIQIVP